MGGFFGVVSRKNCKYDVFFGTDYHSHLGTKRGGIAFYDVSLAKREGNVGLVNAAVGGENFSEPLNVGNVEEGIHKVILV